VALGEGYGIDLSTGRDDQPKLRKICATIDRVPRFSKGAKPTEVIDAEVDDPDGHLFVFPASIAKAAGASVSISASDARNVRHMDSKRIDASLP
jgi:hypothetical protein